MLAGWLGGARAEPASWMRRVCCGILDAYLSFRVSQGVLLRPEGKEVVWVEIRRVMLGPAATMSLTVRVWEDEGKGKGKCKGGGRWLVSEIIKRSITIFYLAYRQGWLARSKVAHEHTHSWRSLRSSSSSAEDLHHTSLWVYDSSFCPALQILQGQLRASRRASFSFCSQIKEKFEDVEYKQRRKAKRMTHYSPIPIQDCQPDIREDAQRRAPTKSKCNVTEIQNTKKQKSICDKTKKNKT